jgi:hypothetical protein
VSKLLLNLLVQISKALVNSKIQFLFRKDFFSASVPISPAAYRPIRPFSPTRPPWLHSSSFAYAGRAPPPPRTPPHRPPPAPWSGPDWSSSSLPPFYLAAFPPPHSLFISIEDTIYRHRTAYPSHLRLPPGPIKGDENPRPSLPLFPSLLGSRAPSFALVVSSSRCSSSPPSRHLSTFARAPVRPEPGSPFPPLSVAPPPVSSRAPSHREPKLR